MTTKETLEARVREVPLHERLEQSQQRIGVMCSEGRGPRMCIPVQYTDDDFFICTTLRDAVNTFDQAREALRKCRLELRCCNKQLVARGAHEGASVTEALRLVDEALTAMEDQP